MKKEIDTPCKKCKYKALTVKQAQERGWCKVCKYKKN